MESNAANYLSEIESQLTENKNFGIDSEVEELTREQVKTTIEIFTKKRVVKLATKQDEVKAPVKELVPEVTEDTPEKKTPKKRAANRSKKAQADKQDK